MQQANDGNSYIRNNNATGRIYIGTNATNFLELTQAGLFSILGTGTFNKIPTNEGLYTSSGAGGTTSSNANRFTLVTANCLLTFTDSTVYGSYWTIGTSGFWSIVLVAIIPQGLLGIYRGAFTLNTVPSGTPSTDRLAYQNFNLASNTITFVGRLLAGEVVKVYTNGYYLTNNTGQIRFTLVSAI